MPLNIGSLRAFITADQTGFNTAITSSIHQSERFARAVQRNLDRAAERFSQIGLALTLGVTLPIAAATAKLVKAASDAEETASKFSVVFSQVSKDASAAAKTLSEAYGLSSLESKTLLSNTGDLLAGFGFTQEAALSLSTDVQKLAADLASFSNVEGGTKFASEALTKALLGEREMVKTLGIAILDADVKQRVAINTAKGLTFATEREAKAVATFQLATEQSTNAIGDAERTQKSLANQMRRLGSDISDASLIWGSKLIPIAKLAVSHARDLVKVFRDMDERMIRIAIVSATVAAALGPFLFSVGKLLGLLSKVSGIAATVAKVLGAMSSVVLGMSGPMLAAVAGVALLSVAFADLVGGQTILTTFWNWLVGTLRSVGKFFGEFGSFLRDENAEISKSTQSAIEFIAKAWLSLQFAWDAVKVGFNTFLQVIIRGFEEVLLASAKVAEFAHLDTLSQAAKDAAIAMAELGADIEDTKTDILEDMKLISESMGDAPDILRNDINALVDTFKTIPEGIQKQLEAAFPGVMEKIKTLISQIQAFIDSGEIPGITISAEVETPKLEELDIESQAEKLSTSEMLWQKWAAGVQKSADQWAGTVIKGVDSVIDGFAMALVSGKDFGKALLNTLVSAATQMAAQLLSIAFKQAIAMVAIKKAETAANSAAAAPHPFLIPVFVGLGLAAFAAAVSSVGFSDSGGGGGAGGGTPQIAEAQPVPQARTSPIASSSVIVETPEEESVSEITQTTPVVIRLEDDSELIGSLVRQVRSGRGDGNNTFQLV
jgi:hypothetical protein